MTTMTLLDLPPRSLFDDDDGPATPRDDARMLGAPAAAPLRTASRPDPRDRERFARRSERTLDELITGTWDDLAAGRPAACPVCAAPLEPRYGASARPVAARCGGCGSELD